jgi:hypothetical protein
MAKRKAARRAARLIDSSSPMSREYILKNLLKFRKGTLMQIDGVIAAVRKKSREAKRNKPPPRGARIKKLPKRSRRTQKRR